MIPVLHGVWASGGLAGDFEHIETQTVGSGGAASVTFSSIPGTYKHLQIRAVARTNRAAVTEYFNVRFNSDTGANYSYHYLEGDGASATSGNAASINQAYVSYVAGDSASSNVFGVIVVDLLDYASTSKNKTVRCLGGIDNNGSGRISLISDAWLNNTTAISSMTFTPGVGTSINQYSTFALYGVK